MPKVSPEVPIRHLPFENKGATRDGACETPGIRYGSVVRTLRAVSGGNRALRDRIFVLGGGGCVEREESFREAFKGLVRHDSMVGSLVVPDQECGLAGVEMEVHMN